jgi:spore maturation protein SpmB
MAIWIPTLIATTCSTAAAVAAFFLLRGLPMFRHRPPTDVGEETDGGLEGEIGEVEVPDLSRRRQPMGAARAVLILAFCAAAAVGLALEAGSLLQEVGFFPALRELLQTWAFPLLVAGLLLVGVAGRVRVYESAVEGAKEGLQVAVRIIPYLVAILAAVAMFRASGAMDEVLIPLIDPLTSLIGVPGEVLPMALLRPLSGSGAFGVMSEIVTTHGPDSFIGMLTCTLQGSTETTFYVLALYLGAARVREGRHALAACLIGDVAGFFGAVIACHWFFG